MKISTVERTAEAQAFADNMAGGEVAFYDGAIPADPQATPAGDILATITLNTPAFTVASGVCTIIGTPNDTALVTSTCTFARLKQSDLSSVADCDVSITSGDIVLTKLEMVLDETVQIQSMTYTVPE